MRSCHPVVTAHTSRGLIRILGNILIIIIPAAQINRRKEQSAQKERRPPFPE